MQNIVPVGKDQMQHLEITRDVASRFNHQMGETFVLPEGKTSEDTMLIPGTDGQKMSKSRNNFINIFLDDKALLKQIKSIETDSTPLEEPKNPDTCNVFGLYKLLGSEEQTAQLKAKYLAGNYGFGHAKQELYDLIAEKFKTEREKYNYYINNLEEVDKLLFDGAAKAGKVADGVLKRVREKLGVYVKTFNKCRADFSVGFFYFYTASNNFPGKGLITPFNSIFNNKEEILKIGKSQSKAIMSISSWSLF